MEGRQAPHQQEIDKQVEIAGDRLAVTLNDFSDPTVDVLFAQIREVGTDTDRDDMGWTGIEVRNGEFSSGPEGDRIVERFYGDIHQEVEGVFQQDGISGAFGAKRSR